MIVEQLEKAGLSPNEAKCYLALLRLGSAPASEISRESGIHRVSVYDALRGLREKGLISQIIKMNKMLFEVANPEVILTLIEQKEADLREVKETIPELIQQFLIPKEKPGIQSFKGESGLRTIFEDMLKAKKEILDFGAEFKIKEYLRYYYTQWDRRRIQQRLKMRIIANINIKPVKLTLTEIRYIPNKFTSSVSTYIYENKVALVIWVENPLGVIIEHEKVAESYKNYFEHLWATAK